MNALHIKNLRSFIDKKNPNNFFHKKVNFLLN